MPFSHISSSIGWNERKGPFHRKFSAMSGTPRRYSTFSGTEWRFPVVQHFLFQPNLRAHTRVIHIMPYLCELFDQSSCSSSADWKNHSKFPESQTKTFGPWRASLVLSCRPFLGLPYSVCTSWQTVELSCEQNLITNSAFPTRCIFWWLRLLTVKMNLCKEWLLLRNINLMHLNISCPEKILPLIYWHNNVKRRHYHPLTHA